MAFVELFIKLWWNETATRNANYRTEIVLLYKSVMLLLFGIILCFLSLRQCQGKSTEIKYSTQPKHRTEVGRADGRITKHFNKGRGYELYPLIDTNQIQLETSCFDNIQYYAGLRRSFIRYLKQYLVKQCRFQPKISVTKATGRWPPFGGFTVGKISTEMGFV